MSVGYKAVSWNRQKRIYDTILMTGVMMYLGIFIGLGSVFHPYATIETLLIRAFATAAFVLLTIVLCIGPLCRLDSRFLPLLYNRRHLGVTTFLLGFVHAIVGSIQFHSQADTSPFLSILVSNQRFDSLSQFPFQQLGVLALFILFVMAATSHDFWLRNLTAPAWKRIHMLVYAAYALLVAHVTLGALQSERSPLLVSLLLMSVASVVGLHLAAAWKSWLIDRQKFNAQSDGFVKACELGSIKDNRARIVCLSGERVAIFRYEGKISAVSNVCQHQNGPLGEGRIIDGCITCPWHGFQYQPDTGASPPPFTEKVPTFNVRLIQGDVYVHPHANAPGTRVEPARIVQLEVSA
jgi:methionine sulfoxide reductase heme-binding subunit